MSITLNDYTGLQPAWCPGCGNFGILSALKKALVELDIPPYKLVIVSGIGQAGKLPHYLKCNTFNSLHGRALPVAEGIKIANRDLCVIAVGGDGDAYGEGGNHWLHAMRRNHDIIYMVHNNGVYALTRGQASPTSETGFISGTTPQGSPDPLQPLAIAVAAGASFVARGFAGDIDHLAGLIKLALQNRGFSLLDILQPCVSFNHINTYDWYYRRIYKLDNDGKYDPFNKTAAFEKAEQWGDHIPIGVIYLNKRKVFEDSFTALQGQSLIKKKHDVSKATRLIENAL